MVDIVLLEEFKNCINLLVGLMYRLPVKNISVFISLLSLVFTVAVRLFKDVSWLFSRGIVMLLYELSIVLNRGIVKLLYELSITFKDVSWLFSRGTTILL